MPYGTIKVDNITFTDNSVDKTVSLSGLIQNPTFTGNVTATGTISGDVIRGGTTISGVTVTGTTANFVSGVFTTQISGTTITGTTVAATTGNYTSLTGTTTTGTTANFVSGVFTTQISGATITGTTVATTTGSFVSLTGTTATFTSGIIASGTAALPSLAILSDPNTGIYSPGADQLAISTGGTGRLAVSTTSVSSTLPVAINGAPSTATLSLPNNSNINAAGVSLYYDTNSAYSSGADRYIVNGGAARYIQDSGAHVWLRAASGTAGNPISFLEGMRVFPGGQVGIGLASAAELLSMSGSSSFIGITNTTAAATNYIGTTSSGDFELNTGNASKSILLKIVGIERARIDSSGRLGIGTISSWSLNSVSTKLGVNLSGTTGDGIALFSLQNSANAYVAVGSQYDTGNTNNGSQIRFGIDSVGDTCSMIALATANGSTPVERVRIDRLGNVGIGTTSPEATLHVKGGDIILETANPGTRLIRPTFAGGALQLAGSSATTDRGLRFGLVNNALSFVEFGRFDDSGRLLVGTSSERTNVYYTTVATTPKVQIESVTNSYSNGLSLINYSSSGYSPVITLGLSSSNTQGVNAALGNAFEMGAIQFVGSDGTNFRTGATIVATNDQASSWAVGDCPTRLVFSTTKDGASSPTERVRIDNIGSTFFGYNGNMFAGGASASVAIGGYTNAVGYGIALRPTANNATPMLFMESGGTVVGSINTTVSTTTYGTSSDYRLKENVTPVPNSITRLLQLKPSRFNFIADPNCTVDGFIAHEVQAVVPEAITGTKDEVDADGNPVYQGIDQSKLVPLLTAALQEAIAEINALKDRLTAAGIA